MRKTAVLMSLILTVCIILSSCGKAPSEPLSHDVPTTEDIAAIGNIPDVTDSPETESSVTAAPERVLDDEELRYDVVSIKFNRVSWENWGVSDYYLTNSEIN